MSSQTFRPRLNFRQRPQTTVLILYKYVPKYRAEFFENLRALLDADGIDLAVGYGDPVGEDLLKGDAHELEWGIYRPNKVFRMRNRWLLWQPFFVRALTADLVVVEQANKLLLNIPMLLLRRIVRRPSAYWGHGANLQARGKNRFSELLKRWTLRLPTWWFAYTQGVAKRLQASNYPQRRITVVNNAIDTKSIARSVSIMRQSGQDEELKSELGLVAGATAIYIGSLYMDKNIDFLLEAAVCAAMENPSFSIVLAGDGPLRRLVEDYAERYPRIHYLGRLDGRRKSQVLSVGTLQVIPGLVGLAILDGFAAGLPLVTRNLDYHSPEIDYLQHGVNGVMLPQEISARQFGLELCRILGDTLKMREMSQQAFATGSSISVENMSMRFAEGVTKALR